MGSTVDGDIKLEYRDDFGRVQTPKEAFRAISWKFHGKLPGRKNMERRLLRLENEMKLKTMDVMTSLPTLRALRHVQAADATNLLGPVLSSKSGPRVGVVFSGSTPSPLH